MTQAAIRRSLIILRKLLKFIFYFVLPDSFCVVEGRAVFLIILATSGIVNLLFC